jgi:hypothetical protein
MTAPAAAEEVLYCTDTDANGFYWDEQLNVKRGPFQLERFTVKVISETKRVIRWQGDNFDSEYSCSTHVIFLHCVGIVAGSADVVRPIIFGKSGYTRAFLFGPLLGGPADSNIWIAYGTCTKF